MGGRLILWIFKHLERVPMGYDVITYNLNLSLAVLSNFHRLNALLSRFVVVHAQECLVRTNGIAIVAQHCERYTQVLGFPNRHSGQRSTKLNPNEQKQ